MQPKPQNRTVALEGIIVGGLTMMGFVTGNGPLFGLAGVIGSNWATDIAQRAYELWYRSWFTDRGALNGDVAPALCSAFKGAARQIARDWQQEPYYQRLKSTYPDAAALTMAVLDGLHADAANILEHTEQIGAVLQSTDLSGNWGSDEATARRLLQDSLDQYLYGHDTNLTKFVQERLAAEWLLRFGEFLKDPGPEGTRAWRAFQRLWQESLTAAVEDIQRTSKETLAIARWLQDWAQRLERLSDTQRDSTGEEVLEITLSAVRNRLDDIKKGIAKIEGLTEQIEVNTAQIATDTEQIKKKATRIEGDVERTRVLVEAVLGQSNPSEHHRGDWTKSGPPPPCPYPGMVPFRAEDARFFLGRSNEVEEILMSLRHRPFQIIIGRSGSGKTSLIFAGLLPALKRSSLWPSGFWQVVPMRPGPRPTEVLAQLLGRDLADPAETVAAYLTAQLSRNTTDLQSSIPNPHLLLVVDQFEEIFAQADVTEQRRFIAVLQALRALEACTVLLTLRADFYPELMDSKLWPVTPNERIEITPLRGDALRQAISRPAANVGAVLESGLVERLLADGADEPGSLPLLQETLVLLWDHMEDRVLTLRAYEHLGGRWEGGKRNGLAVAVASKADATLETLTPDQQMVARRIFLRLIQFGEDQRHTRQQQSVTALRADNDDPATFDETLRKLTDNRLLTLSGEEDDPDKRVDLAHEALIASWPTLQSWIAENQQAEATRRRLERKAKEWQEWQDRGQGQSGLLDEGELSEAERWLTNPNASKLGHSRHLAALIEVSRAASKKAEEAKLDQIRMTERARVLTKRNRILRLLTTALIGALLTAVSLGIIAYQQGIVARVQALAANAVSQLDVDPERSLLLAMEAVLTTRRVGIKVVPQAQEALDQAVARSRVRRKWRAHHDDVTTVAYSPDGKQIVTGSKERSVSIWEASATEKLVATLKGEQGHTEQVNSVAYSPDGKRLITTSEDKTVKIWDTATWQPVTGTLELPGDRNQALDAAYSPDGKSIVVAAREDQARIWDTVASRWVLTLTGHTARVTSASYSPDGQHVVTASWDETVRVWDVTTGRTTHIFKGHTGQVTRARYSPDGASIISASQDNTARIWDVEKGEERRILQSHNDWVYDARYSPDGHSIVTASGDGTARVWDAASGEERFTMRGHTDAVLSATYSPDGRTIVTVSIDQTVRVWDASDQLAWVMTAVYNRDGRLILSASSDNKARVWDVETQQPVITITGHTNLLYSALFSPNQEQEHIVTASGDRTAKVWNIASLQAGTVITRPAMTLTHTGAVTSAAYSPDGKNIVTTSRDGRNDIDKDIDNVIIWDAISSQALVTFTHEYDLFSAAYSPDGKRIVATGKGKIAVIWDVMTSQQGMIPASTPAITLTGHTDWVYDAAFSPDGTRIVTGSADRTARIWDASNGKVIKILRGHENVVRRVAYSPDERFIITASWDNTVKVWDVATGQIHLTLRGHRNWVMSAAFSPDGGNIVTASADGTMYSRPINIDELLALAEKRVTRPLTEEEKSTYLSQSCALSIFGICLP